jgi:hypothetical protein
MARPGSCLAGAPAPHVGPAQGGTRRIHPWGVVPARPELVWA